MAFVEGEQGHGELAGRWLLLRNTGVSTGVCFFDQGGAMHDLQLPDAGPGWNRGAVATLPRGGSRRAHPAVVGLNSDSQSAIWALDLDGKASLLAGTMSDPPPGGPEFVDGPGAQARFGFIKGLAMDLDGNVYVNDRGIVIRVVTPAGQVSTLAGHRRTPNAAGEWPPYADGKGKDVCFVDMESITCDPVEKVLYVLDADRRICKVTTAGEVTTVLPPDDSGIQVQGTAPAQPLGGGALRLAWFNGLLVLPDPTSKVVKLFNPHSKVFATLVGDPSQPTLRGGPVRLFSPDLPPERCAACAWPREIAINAEGQGLLSDLENKVVMTLDLSPLAAPAPAVPGSGAAAAPAPRGPGGSAAAPPH
jgi:hypothetical protein